MIRKFSSDRYRFGFEYVFYPAIEMGCEAEHYVTARLNIPIFKPCYVRRANANFLGEERFCFALTPPIFFNEIL